MSITTRPASRSDRMEFDRLESQLNSREAGFADQLFAAIAAGSHSLILGYQHADAPSGYVVFNRHPSYSLFARLGVPELQDLNVLADHRNNGLGRALVLACEELARAEGHDRIGLAVGLGRSYGAAQRLYTRLGYIPDGYGVTYDRQPVGDGEFRPVDDNLCLMMVKDLA